MALSGGAGLVVAAFVFAVGVVVVGRVHEVFEVAEVGDVVVA